MPSPFEKNCQHPAHDFACWLEEDAQWRQKNREHLARMQELEAELNDKLEAWHGLLPPRDRDLSMRATLAAVAMAREEEVRLAQLRYAMTRAGVTEIPAEIIAALNAKYPRPEPKPLVPVKRMPKSLVDEYSAASEAFEKASTKKQRTAATTRLRELEARMGEEFMGLAPEPSTTEPERAEESRPLDAIESDLRDAALNVDAAETTHSRRTAMTRLNELNAELARVRSAPKKPKRRAPSTQLELFR